MNKIVTKDKYQNQVLFNPPLNPTPPLPYFFLSFAKSIPIFTIFKIAICMITSSIVQSKLIRIEFRGNFQVPLIRKITEISLKSCILP